MYVQVITYKIGEVSDADFNEANQGFAEAMREVPGLISKVWLKSDNESGSYGGVYFWRDKESCDAFLNGELLGEVRADDSVRELTTREYTVNEVMTKLTQPVLQII